MALPLLGFAHLPLTGGVGLSPLKSPLPKTTNQGAAAPYWMYPREIRSPSAVGATQARPIQAEQQNQDFGHGAAAVGGQSPIENRPRRPEIARLLARSPRLNGGPGGGKGKHQTFPECLCFHTPPHPRRFFGSFCITAKGTRSAERNSPLFIKTHKKTGTLGGVPISFCYSIRGYYLAYSIALVSRSRWTLIWPGYSSSSSIFLAISRASRTI